MVGDILRQERERQKLSIKDIERATSIRALYIEAIENSDNATLPGQVYTKGFIRNYANFLKLDSESLVKQYREEVSPGSVSTAPETQSSTEKTAAPVAQQKSQSEPKSEPAIKVERKSPFNAVEEEDNNRKSLMAVAAVLVCAIVGGLYYYFTNVEGNELASAPVAAPQQMVDQPVVDQQAVEQPAVEQKAVEQKAVEQPKVEQPKAEPQSTPVAATGVASAAPSKEGVNLEARFNDRCWTKVTADGAVVFEGTVEPGQLLSWKANRQIDVTAGNAGAVEFIENGVNLGVAGAVGDVIDKTFVKK